MQVVEKVSPRSNPLDLPKQEEQHTEKGRLSASGGPPVLKAPPASRWTGPPRQRRRLPVRRTSSGKSQGSQGDSSGGGCHAHGSPGRRSRRPPFLTEKLTERGVGESDRESTCDTRSGDGSALQSQSSSMGLPLSPSHQKGDARRCPKPTGGNQQRLERAVSELLKVLYPDRLSKTCTFQLRIR